MKRFVLTYITIGLICILSSGCAASIKSNRANVGNNLPSNLSSTNVDSQNPYLVHSSLERLTNFINSYNKNLGYDRARLIADAILQASNTYRVNYRVVTALVAIESGFRADAQSPSGAMGLGQLMPATARGLEVSDPFDPQDNLNGAVKLLRTHLEKFNGNINYVLGAYKMGAGTVSRSGINQPTTISYIKQVRDVFDQVP